MARQIRNTVKGISDYSVTAHVDDCGQIVVSVRNLETKRTHKRVIVGVSDLDAPFIHIVSDEPIAESVESMGDLS